MQMARTCSSASWKCVHEACTQNRINVPEQTIGAMAKCIKIILAMVPDMLERYAFAEFRELWKTCTGLN